MLESHRFKVEEFVVNHMMLTTSNLTPTWCYQGLRHGEFTLPFGMNEAMVKELAWNSDSTMLALWIEPLATHVQGGMCVP